MAPDGSGRARRERAALRRRRRRRREGAGRRGRREAGEAPAAGRARGRLRGAGAGARAGSRGGYDDPAAGPRIASPPPPPRGGPGSRLRTTPTGGESGRARMDGVRAPWGGRPEVAPSGLPGAAGLHREPLWAGPARPREPRPAAWSRAAGRDRVPGKLPLPPATSLPSLLLSSGDRGPSGGSPPSGSPPLPLAAVAGPYEKLVRVHVTPLPVALVRAYLCFGGPGSRV